jgi:hypothetical protein
MGKTLSRSQETLSKERIRHAVREWQWQDALDELEKRDFAPSLVDELITAWDNRDGLWYFCSPDLVLLVLPHCTTAQLDRVLVKATRVGRWSLAGEVLKVGGSETQRKRTVEEACNRASNWYFNCLDRDLFTYILPHCTHEFLQSRLEQFVVGHLWMSVGLVLKRGVSKIQHRWAVEASKTASETDFVNHILPHCNGAHLESGLTHLIRRHLWTSVGLVLKRGVSKTHHRWAVEDASKSATETDFVKHILPHCTGAHLESGLTHLIRRHLWTSVGLVLKRGVSKTQHRWTVEEASKSAEENDFINHILPHCTGTHLESVLAHLTSRGLLKSVGLVLERGVSDTQHRQAVEEASKRAKDGELINYIWPHRSGDRLESALPHLVSRRLWKSVGLVMARGVCDTQHSWVEAASKRAEERNFISHILSRYTGAHIESYLTHLFSRRLWKHVGLVLENGVSIDKLGLAVSEACKCWTYTTLMDGIEKILGPKVPQL